MKQNDFLSCSVRNYGRYERRGGMGEQGGREGEWRGGEGGGEQ